MHYEKMKTGIQKGGRFHATAGKKVLFAGI